jgi:hypothetical protein
MHATCRWRARACARRRPVAGQTSAAKMVNWQWQQTMLRVKDGKASAACAACPPARPPAPHPRARTCRGGRALLLRLRRAIKVQRLRPLPQPGGRGGLRSAHARRASHRRAVPQVLRGELRHDSRLLPRLPGGARSHALTPHTAHPIKATVATAAPPVRRWGINSPSPSHPPLAQWEFDLTFLATLPEGPPPARPAPCSPPPPLPRSPAP